MTYRSPSSSLTMRPAAPGDAAALARVAALDSAPLPAGAVLVGLIDDRIVAAVSIDDGHAIADPFVRTADLACLLRDRALAIRAAEHGTHGAARRPLRTRVRDARRGLTA